MKPPHWLDRARSYAGVREVKGKGHNQTILRWWGLIRAPFVDDETPWCAAFVGGVLEESGIRSTRSAAARSYERWGVDLGLRPAVGAVAVLWRGSPKSWSGHVAFVEGVDQHGNIMLRGGNQGDEVNVSAFDPNRVLSYRWPSVWPHDERFDLPLIPSDGRRSINEA